MTSNAGESSEDRALLVKQLGRLSLTLPDGRQVQVVPETSIRFSQDNPKKGGSNAHENFERYKGAQNIFDFFQLQGPSRTRTQKATDLKHDVSKGFATLPNTDSLLPPKEAKKEKEETADKDDAPEEDGAIEKNEKDQSNMKKEKKEEKDTKENDGTKEKIEKDQNKEKKDKKEEKEKDGKKEKKEKDPNKEKKDKKEDKKQKVDKKEKDEKEVADEDKKDQKEEEDAKEKKAEELQPRVLTQTTLDAHLKPGMHPELLPEKAHAAKLAKEGEDDNAANFWDSMVDGDGDEAMPTAMPISIGDTSSSAGPSDGVKVDLRSWGLERLRETLKNLGEDIDGLSRDALIKRLGDLPSSITTSSGEPLRKKPKTNSENIELSRSTTDETVPPRGSDTDESMPRKTPPVEALAVSSSPEATSQPAAPLSERKAASPSAASSQLAAALSDREVQVTGPPGPQAQALLAEVLGAEGAKAFLHFAAAIGSIAPGVPAQAVGNCEGTRAWEVKLRGLIALGDSSADRVCEKVLSRAKSGMAFAPGLPVMTFEEARVMLLRCGGKDALKRDRERRFAGVTQRSM